VNLLSNNFLSIGNKKIITDRFIDRKSTKRKLPALFRRYFPQKNTVCNSVGDYLTIFFKKSILQNYKIIKLI